jgi:hypothetical protein
MLLVLTLLSILVVVLFCRGRCVLIGKRCAYFSMFACHNINCYSTFRTERGLRQHLFCNAGCQQYMTHNGICLYGSVNDNEGGQGQAPLLRRCASYGVECMLLNRMMNAIVVPIYCPFDAFDFGATNYVFEVDKCAGVVTIDSSDDETRADVFCDSVSPRACME